VSRQATESPLRLPRYSVARTRGDEFFRSHLELEVVAHFSAVEPQFRCRNNGQAELELEIQRFVDRAIAVWRGEDPDKPVVPKTKQNAKGATPDPKRSRLSAKLARAKALRKEGKDTYTPKGGPAFIRILQGGVPD
jgi:hypothetical protein